jgi:hypothetical protein
MSRFIDSVAFEKAPYILTVLFALIGWGMKHSVDRLLGSPILAFTSEVTPAGAHQLITITLQNISHDKSFKDLKFVLIFPRTPSGKFVEASKVATPPAWDGDQPAYLSEHSVEFDFPVLHPNWEVKLGAKFSGKVIPVFRVSKSETPLRVIPQSLETILVRHELQIILGMIAFWFLLILVIIVVLGHRKQANKLADSVGDNVCE